MRGNMQLVAPVDYKNVEKPQGYNAYQRAEEEFQLKKALAQAQVMKAMQPESKFKVVGNQIVRMDEATGSVEPVYEAPSKYDWQTVQDPNLGFGQVNTATGEFKPFPVANKATAAAEKKTEGKQEFEDSLANLANRYTELKKMGGITSTAEGGLSNMGASLSASGFGQTLGGFFGTKEQSERNKIAGEVPLLTQAIKNATGMSAQQMNSNVELQTFLKALGDPKNDYEANMEIIKNLSKKYGTGEVAGAYESAPPMSNGAVIEGKINYADPRVQKAFDAGYSEQQIIEYLGGK